MVEKWCRSPVQASTSSPLAVRATSSMAVLRSASATSMVVTACSCTRHRRHGLPATGATTTPDADMCGSSGPHA